MTQEEKRIHDINKAEAFNEFVSEAKRINLTVTVDESKYSQDAIVYENGRTDFFYTELVALACRLGLYNYCDIVNGEVVLVVFWVKLAD